MKHFLTLSISLMFILNQTSGQDDTNNERLASGLKKLNDRLIKAAIDKDFQSISDLYSDSTLVLAEYQPMLDSKDEISRFYQEIFKRQDLRNYTRNTVEITDFGNIILEIGLFEKVFQDNSLLNGKYFNSWSKDTQGQLTLRAECFGFFGEPEDKDDFRVTSVKDDSEPLKGRNGKAIPKEIQVYNAFGENLVRDRDTQGVVDSYTKDGIYFPYADTAKTGYQEFLTHFKGYHKNPVKIDSIEVWTHDFDEVPAGVIKYNKFYVKWTLPNGYTGTTSGTGIAFWKQTPGNAFRIHRQLATHTHNP